jgi:hypothetical protein
MSQGKRHNERYLRNVASIYIDAYDNDVPVQEAVAQALGVPISTATKQIMSARRRGLIPTSERLKLMKEYEKTKDNLRKLEQAIKQL